jgi:hypothetical protein
MIVIVRGCVQKFPDWPPGARPANGTAPCHEVQLHRYSVSQSSEFYRHNPLCCFSTTVYCCLFRYRLSPETFGYTLANLDKELIAKVTKNNLTGTSLSLCFNWAPRYEGLLGEWMYSFTHCLTSALDGGEWSALRPGSFTPKERARDIHWIGGWIGARTSLDTVV